MDKKHLFSVTKKDCKWEFFRSGGAGGQHRDKTSNAVRVRHIDSGAVGICSDHRERDINIKVAFRRMAETKAFQSWARIKAQEISGELDRHVDEMMQDKNLLIEVFKDGKWRKEDA